jgi:hypothetical protein
VNNKRRPTSDTTALGFWVRAKALVLSSTRVFASTPNREILCRKKRKITRLHEGDPRA